MHIYDACVNCGVPTVAESKTFFEHDISEQMQLTM